MKKRRCILVVLALMVVFGSVSVASAYTMGVATVYTNRTSNTSARVSADIIYSKTVKSATTKITLQEKYNGSWRTATGVPVKTVSKTKSNVTELILPYTLKLVKGKVYRIKAVFTNVYGGITTSQTLYSGAF